MSAQRPLVAEVIVTAFAIGSHQILPRTVIGPAALLSEFGIPVRHDLLGAGENFRDHWMIRVQHRVENTVTFNVWTQSLGGGVGSDYSIS